MLLSSIRLPSFITVLWFSWNTHSVCPASSAGLVIISETFCSINFFALFNRCQQCFSVLFAFLIFIRMQGSERWSSSIFGVFADGCATCLISSWIPCVQHGRNAERYTQLTDPQASSNFFPEAATFFCLGFGTASAVNAVAFFAPAVSYSAGCLPFAALAGFSQVPMRRKVREMYGISESDSCCGSDFMTASCCLCCNLIQLSRQLKNDPPDHLRW